MIISDYKRCINFLRSKEGDGVYHFVRDTRCIGVKNDDRGGGSISTWVKRLVIPSKLVIEFTSFPFILKNLYYDNQ